MGSDRNWTRRITWHHEQNRRQNRPEPNRQLSGSMDPGKKSAKNGNGRIPYLGSTSKYRTWDKFLFNYLHRSTEAQHLEVQTEDGVIHRFKYLDQVPLNESNQEVKVHVLHYEELKPGTKRNLPPQPKTATWVTDLPLEAEPLMKIKNAGRARWKIENETFNTLKNQGYHFEPNFGHGNKHLSTGFGLRMMLACLIDPIELRCDGRFNDALDSACPKNS